MTRLERLAFAVLIFAAGVFAWFGLFTFVADQLPPPVTKRTCTCAGKDDCDITVFNTDGTRYAYCARWGENESCCVIEPSPAPDDNGEN